MITSPLSGSLQGSLNCSFSSDDGFPSTPGIKVNQELNAQVRSRRWKPSPTPVSGATVSIINGLYRLDGTGDFVSPGTTWGTSRYIETLVMSDSDEYEKNTTAIQLVGGVEYNFVAQTKAE
jgi:hypothetical protein